MKIETRNSLAQVWGKKKQTNKTRGQSKIVKRNCEYSLIRDDEGTTTIRRGCWTRTE